MEKKHFDSVTVARALCLFVRREGGLRHDRIDTKELYSGMERGAKGLGIQAIPAAGISRATACRLYATAARSPGKPPRKLGTASLGKIN